MLHQRYQSFCASKTFTMNMTTKTLMRPDIIWKPNGIRYKTFRFDDYQSSSVRSPRDRTTHDPSSRYHRQGEITRQFNGIVDPFRTTGIGSALDPADRTCARSRRSSLVSRLRTIDEIVRWWRNKPSGRRRRVHVGAVDFTVDRRMNPVCSHPESDKHFILLTYSQIFLRIYN